MLLGAASLLAASQTPAEAEPPAPGRPVVIDGPSAGAVALGGMSIARDGTGGLVYVKELAGVPHVFVSRLAGGVFQAPEQVDSALAGQSSEPVIAAGRGGVLLIGFINSQELYVVDRSGSSAQFSAPIPLFAGAMHPALQMTNFGKGYLAFTADAGAGNHDVRAAYYRGGTWALEPTPLDAAAADDAGTGTGRPQIAAAGDGVGIVVWGEAGHVISRRVWGTAPSGVYEQADVPLPGCSETSADQPVVGAGGDSSFAAVVFHEALSCSGQPQSRVLMRRLRASQYDGVSQPDGLSTPAADGAAQPRVAVAEYGGGFVTSAREASKQLFAAGLIDYGAVQSTFRADSAQNTTLPYAVPAIVGLFTSMIAWQRTPPTFGLPEIRIRYSQDGSTLDPEQVVSTPILGPTDAASGLAAGGDSEGDAAAAWVQGAAGSARIVAAQLYRRPGPFGALRSFQYVSSRRPLLAWSPAKEQWGSVSYRVRVDGAQVGQTTATSFLVPRPLRDGRHRWQVTAVNPGGLDSVAAPATVWVDTVPPVARMTLTGSKRVGGALHLAVRASDPPSPVPGAGSSGIAGVVVRWGDGTKSSIRHRNHAKLHVYRRPGRYKLTLTVRDRAGNRTVVVRHIRIV